MFNDLIVAEEEMTTDWPLNMKRLGHTLFSAGISTPNTSHRAEGHRGGCIAASSQAGSVSGKRGGVGLEWGAVILSPPSVLFVVGQHVILGVT